MTYRKKLIEVALPLEAINKASAREKSIRHGHPSTLHLWWARRPLAAARAVIFAQMVDDPSAYPELFRTQKAQEKERQRLFKIIEDLVQWENSTNKEVLESAREEIWQSWRRACAENVDHPRAKELFDRKKLPAFHDPFAGGGALPLEAQRLGLEAYGSDLNPVSVLINKAMIEIPPRFVANPPINPESRAERTLLSRDWKGAEGLAADVRYYGKWMRDEAGRRVGHLYPKIEVTAEMAKGRSDLKPLINKKLTAIAWLWARTVKSPNPAYSHVDVPLAATFVLGTKPGREVYIQPVIEADGYHFTIRKGKPENAKEITHGTKTARGANFACLMSGAPISGDYIKAEGVAGRMRARLMAVVAEGERGRVYLAPTDEMEKLALEVKPTWRPEEALVQDARAFTPTLYGLTHWGKLFTDRQTVTLMTLADLVQQVHKLVEEDGARAGCGNPDAYANAISTYLGLAVGRVADYCSTICTWANNPQMEIVRGTFARQALPMTWDFAETNPFGPSTGSIEIVLGWIGKVVERFSGYGTGRAWQQDAAGAEDGVSGVVVSTDPPYFDNVPYADLSDFFYVWLRRALRPCYPNLFATVAVPKMEELVATSYRHGGKERAEAFFLGGMTRAMRRLAEATHPGVPLTIYYAFKQAESGDEDGLASTGWETFLAAVIQAGLAISGTWPIRTEREGRSRGIGSNALASSIVLVCRPRSASAATATRREFVNVLKAELPAALAHLQRSNIAPVDLAQAAIGPGMAVYTRYARVLDADGKPLPIREALTLINHVLDEVLAEQEGDFDAHSRWALAWFEQFGFTASEYGVAEVLATAKVTAVAGLVDAGLVESKRGKVRLLTPDELPHDWDPSTDQRLTVWEMVHHLIRVLEAGGESAAGVLAEKLGTRAEIARELAYRLYTLSERKKRPQEALRYNTLVQSWPEIVRLAKEGAKARPASQEMFAEEEG